jgi:glycosyltransferase involved in cell wall biosynthesis
MSHKSPLVTVITPAYNRADYLPETLDSVLNQDYANIEYIVLDDGSKDDTVAVLREYEARLKNQPDARVDFKWDSHANMGEAKTVNKGFGLARGEYIVIVNSDDPILPGLISAAVDLLEAHPDVLAAYPDFEIIDQHGRTLEHRPMPDYDYVRMVREYYCMPGPGAFIRRRGIEQVGGRDTRYRYVGDFDFWLRLGLYGPFVRLPRTLATWRDHPASASISERSRLMAEERVTLMENFYAQPNLPPEILAVKAQAMSSAYYAGALMIGDAAAARPYYWRSLRYHLNSRPLGQPRSWKVMLASFVLPGAVTNSLLRRRHAAKMKALQDHYAGG